MNIKKFKQEGGPSLQQRLARAAELIELVLGLIILVHCIISTVGIVCSLNVTKLFYNTAYLQYQLSSACLIITGLELITMIASYSIDSVVDVMLLAVSRQMIVEHTAPLENLLTVLSVGLLFLIRKYLYISKIDKRYPAKSVKKENEPSEK